MPAPVGRRHALPAALLRYRAVLQLPGAVAFYLTSLPMRLGAAMLNLAVIVLVHADTGSYATAGAIAGVLALAGSLGGPLGARLTDRYGQRHALPPLLAVHATGVMTLLAAARWHAPTGVLLSAAALAGGCQPPTGALTRARWNALAPGPGLLGTAFAVESLTDDLSYVLGPALATTLGAVVGPATGLLAAVGLILVGGLALAGLRPSPCPGPRSGPRHPVRIRTHRPGLLGPLAVPGVRVLAAAFVGVGMVFSGLQVSVTAFAAGHGQPAAAGPIYSGFGVASMAAGAVYGAVRWRATPTRRLLVGFTLLAVGGLALPAVDGLGTMAVAIAVPGLAIAPTLITGNGMVRALSPADSITEAFAWLGGAGGLGIAVGSTLAGRLVDATGPHAGFVVPVAAAGAAALVVAAARRRLAPTDP